MGKWSKYQKQEGKYLVTTSHDVVRLKRYLFQDYYLDYDDKKVHIGDLDNVFDSEEEANSLSSKLIAQDNIKRAAYEEEKRIQKEKEEERQARKKRDYDYLDNLSYSESRYYLD